LKGVVSTIQKLILMVIVVAIVALVAIQFIPRTASDLEEYFEQMWGTGNTIDAVRFRNAVKCSYWRCVTGCDSTQVKIIDNVGINPENPMENFGCYDFCEPGKKNYCNDDAAKKPIIVKNNRNLFVKKELWFKSEVDCIGTYESAKAGGTVEDVLQNLLLSIPSTIWSALGGKYDLKLLVLNKDFESEYVSNQEKEDCYVAAQKVVRSALKSFELKPGEYKIVTTMKSPLLQNTLIATLIDKK